MSLSDVIIWFADRTKTPTKMHVIVLRLGRVHSQLDHLVQLGILHRRCNHRAGDVEYSLKNWDWYQERAA